MMSRLLAIAVMILASSGAAFAACHVENYRFSWGVDTSTQMTASSGQPCTSIMHTSGTFKSVKVITPAKHGVGGSAGLMRWGYQSKPGYVGPDDFVVQIDGENARGGAGVTNISVHVDVVR